MFAKIENNKVVEFPITNLRQLLSNISFPEPILDNHIEHLGYVNVFPSDPPTTSKTEVAVPDSAELKSDGKWYMTWKIEPRSTEEIFLNDSNLPEIIKIKRNMLLSESDWTQVADAPVDKLAWSTYRQQLRDITNQNGFPKNVIWPSKPT